MKILLICMLATCAVTLNSCNKEGKFDGTTWIGELDETKTYGNLLSYTYEHDLTLDFTGTNVSVKLKTDAHMQGTPSLSYNKSATGTFACDKKDEITITIDGKTWTGTYDKKTMSLNVTMDWNLDTIEEKIVFTKK